MNHELVSIGIPVFNGEKFLERALNSLINQSYTNIEIIISDNFSNDMTEEICNKFKNLDQRIRYIRQSDTISLVKNFNFVLNAAKGKYFIWNAHDDIRDSKYIEMCLSVFEKDPDVGLVHCDAISFFSENKEERYTSSGYINNNKNKIIKFLYRLFNENPGLIYGVHKRELLQSFFEEKNYDYMDNYVGIWYEINSSIKTIPLPLFYVGIDGNQILGKPINNFKMISKQFTEQIYLLLRKNFGFISANFLYLITKVIYLKIDHSINKQLLIHKNKRV